MPENEFQDRALFLFKFFLQTLCWTIWSRCSRLESVDFPNFTLLDAQIGFFIEKIFLNSNFNKKNQFGRAKGLIGKPISPWKPDCFCALWIFPSERRSWGCYCSFWFFRIVVHGNDVLQFDTRWDEVFLWIKEAFSDNMLENLCNVRIRESDQFQNVLALCEQVIEQHLGRPNYQKLKR